MKNENEDKTWLILLNVLGVTCSADEGRTGGDQCPGPGRAWRATGEREGASLGTELSTGVDLTEVRIRLETPFFL